MNLESQLTNQQLSAKLKSLGVEQKSLFYFTNYELGEFGTWDKWPLSLPTQHHLDETEGGYLPKDYQCYSAFSVAELGIALPDGVVSVRYGKKWSVGFNQSEDIPKEFDDMANDAWVDENHANALGQMLKSLLKGGYISVSSVNERMGAV